MNIRTVRVISAIALVAISSFTIPATQAATNTGTGDIAGVPGALKLFNVAFVVVLVSLLVQGPSLGWLARKLRLPSGATAAPAAPSEAPAA